MVAHLRLGRNHHTIIRQNVGGCGLFADVEGCIMKKSSVVMAILVPAFAIGCASVFHAPSSKKDKMRQQMKTEQEGAVTLLRDGEIAEFNENKSDWGTRGPNLDGVDFSGLFLKIFY